MNLSGSPFDYLIAFGGGVLMSFTPCVYPLLPVSVGYISMNASGSRMRGLALSFVYASGLAVTYSFLGVLASITGSLFGKISTHPLTYFVSGGIIIFYGLSMFDLFFLNFPGIKIPQFKRKNYFSTFFLGAASGLIVSPCVTPVLYSILLFLGTKKNVIYGATLLLAFAYGLGFLMMVVSTFSSLLVNRPMPGKWLIFVKRFTGAVLLVIGINFIIRGIGGF